MSTLAFRCRRCSAVLTEPCDDPAVEIRRRIETGQLYTVHECTGAWLGRAGAPSLGIAELIGEGQKPKQETAA